MAAPCTGLGICSINSTLFLDTYLFLCRPALYKYVFINCPHLRQKRIEIEKVIVSGQLSEEKNDNTT
jgi:hypothetical protein